MTDCETHHHRCRRRQDTKQTFNRQTFYTRFLVATNVTAIISPLLLTYHHRHQTVIATIFPASNNSNTDCTHGDPQMSSITASPPPEKITSISFFEHRYKCTYYDMIEGHDNSLIPLPRVSCGVAARQSEHIRLLCIPSGHYK